MNYNQEAIKWHKKWRGKIEIAVKAPLRSKADLARVYTPGVGAVSMAISKDKEKSWKLTGRGNMVAIVTNGTAVLGLGNIGPEAAVPVMEGKATIFKKFAGIDAVPLCINARDAEEIVKFVTMIEPQFAGINLEDIAAPACFTILERLEKKLSIPVFHDDQDGTAIVVLAALINACRVTGKILSKLKIVVNGAGAAGIAIVRLLLAQGVKDIILLDSRGTIYIGRDNLNPYKKKIARLTNKRKIKGRLGDALLGADVLIGVSKGNVVTSEMVKKMANEPIVFALANPVPEIMPDKALAAGAAVVGTGRSDFPNQINNALVFPGLFRGLLDGRIHLVTTRIKTKVALAIAYSLKPSKNKILPSLTDRRIVKIIAQTVKRGVV